ncbi:MAG: efflux RND transporter permease subunit [Porticoccaceae bacterium]
MMRMAVVSNRLTEEELANIVEDQISPALLAVPGVAEVSVNGDREKVLHVRIDPLRIASYGLSVQDIADVLSTAQFDIPAGSFESILIRSFLSVQTHPFGKLRNLTKCWCAMRSFWAMLLTSITARMMQHLMCALMGVR